ncbi:TetR/AcrR family transcriptional regulator [Streptomyces sp. HNM0574]|nr:TetR/AcrR family transcriptional regulator [Streptomyces sp. HNM0574]
MRTRAALVQAGARAFGELGFVGASVQKITKDAGVTLGAMYFHFASKEDLAREIIRSQPGRLTLGHGSAGLQRAVDITLHWASQLLEDPILLAGARLVMDQEYFITPEEESSHHQWAEVVIPTLRDAQRNGELRADVDVDALARLIVNGCTGAQMHAQLSSRRIDLVDRVAEMWRLLLPLVTPDGAPRITLQAESPTAGDNGTLPGPRAEPAGAAEN